jgi:glycosyltransferase involved in cell wall biosynthesis
MPKLSIITVNLNNKAGLIDTAQSVVVQTWTDYEWLIIDGGSTDGSVEVIKEYAGKTDKLVYWCSEPDGGIYQGMNKGIEKASGEYCWFLNSGDYAYQNTTLAEVFANEFDEDIVYGDIKKGEQKTLIIAQEVKKIKSPVFWIHYTFCHQSTIIKSDILKKIKYEIEYRIAADYMFFMRAVFHYNVKIKKIPIIFCVYDDKGVSGTERGINKKERKKIFMKIFNNYQYLFYHLLSSIRYGKVHNWINITKDWKLC